MKSIMNGTIALVAAAVGFGACQKHDSDREPVASVNESRSGESVASSQDMNERHTNTNNPTNGTDEPSTNAANAVRGGQSSAVSAITAARCEREQKCNNIGADKKFKTTGDCVNTIRNNWKDDLNARECPGGVVQKELDECLDAIRKEDCNNPFDTLSRVMACRESDICKKLD